MHRYSSEGISLSENKGAKCDGEPVLTIPETGPGCRPDQARRIARMSLKQSTIDRRFPPVPRRICYFAGFSTGFKMTDAIL